MPYVSAGGGLFLLLNGSNYMDIDVAMESATQVDLRSRRNSLSGFVGDNFDDGILNSALWNLPTTNWGCHGIEERAAAPNVLRLNLDDNSINPTTDPKIDYVSSKFVFAGDFDISIELDERTINGDVGGAEFIQFGLCSFASAAAAEWSKFITADATTANGAAIWCTFQASDVAGNNEIRSGIKASGGGVAPNAFLTVVPAGPPAGTIIKLTRTGTAMTAQYKRPLDPSFVTLQSTTGPAGDLTILIFMRFGQDTGTLGDDSFGDMTAFQVNSGAASKTEGDGPFVVVEGLGSQLADDEPIIEFWSGAKETPANKELSLLHRDIGPVLLSHVADGATAIGLTVRPANDLVTGGAQLFLVEQQDGDNMFYVDLDGDVWAARGMTLANTNSGYAIGSGSNIIKMDGSNAIKCNVGGVSTASWHKTIGITAWAGKFSGGIADGAGAIGAQIGPRVAYANATAKLLSIADTLNAAPVEKASFDVDGNLTIENATSQAAWLNLNDEGGDDRFLFMRDQGAFNELRIHTADPGADDTLGQLVGPNAGGEIYCKGASATQTTSATPGNYDVITGFTTDSGLGTLGVTEAAASNKITADVAGTYLVFFHATFSGSSARTYSFLVYVNGVAQDQAACGRYLGTGTDLGDTGIPGARVSAAAGQDIDVRVACSAASQNFIPRDMHLSILKVN